MRLSTSALISTLLISVAPSCKDKDTIEETPPVQIVIDQNHEKLDSALKLDIQKIEDERIIDRTSAVCEIIEFLKQNCIPIPGILLRAKNHPDIQIDIEFTQSEERNGSSPWKLEIVYQGRATILEGETIVSEDCVEGVAIDGGPRSIRGTW